MQFVIFIQFGNVSCIEIYGCYYKAYNDFNPSQFNNQWECTGLWQAFEWKWIPFCPVWRYLLNELVFNLRFNCNIRVSSSYCSCRLIVFFNWLYMYYISWDTTDLMPYRSRHRRRFIRYLLVKMLLGTSFHIFLMNDTYHAYMYQKVCSLNNRHSGPTYE